MQSIFLISRVFSGKGLNGKLTKAACNSALFGKYFLSYKEKPHYYHIMISRFRTRSGLLTEELDGALIVVDVQAGKVHELNSTAAWLWARLDHWVDAGELTETLCQHYDISTETAQKDVKMILDQLHNRGLLIENQT